MRECVVGFVKYVLSAVLIYLLLEHKADLIGGKWGGKVVAVKVPPCVDMCQADGLATLDGDPTVAHGANSATHAPVTITILYGGDSCHRLLSTT